MNLRFQLKKMIRSLQYRVAFLISSVCVCLALFLEVWKSRGVDRFAVVSASEAVCGYGLSYGWKIFSAILAIFDRACMFHGGMCTEEKESVCVGNFGADKLEKLSSWKIGGVSNW